MPEEEKREKKEERRELSTLEPVETSHQITVAGKPLKYRVVTGYLPLRSEFGEHEANVFFIAYLKEGNRMRPLTLSFNGGPGSSSVWLHLGALGPKRAKMLDDGMLPPPPYELADNPETWLTETDLVFIDPVGTGYSRAATKELGKKFWGVKGDIESMGEFIRLFLTRYERWDSPLYLVGESYGTTRAAGLAGHLIDRGVAFNGIILVSSILNFQTARFVKGNDLPYILFLPTYTATAWFHKTVPNELQKDLRKTLAEAEEFALGEYKNILAKGDLLSKSERAAAAQKIARLTGLSETFVDNTNLRPKIMAFCKELLRNRKRTVGRLDSRFTGNDEAAAGETPEHDPSMTAIRAPYTSMFNQYVRTKLGFKTDLVYHILGGGIEEPWDWGSAGEGHPDTSESLRQAFAKNPYMRVFIASGYYDLATPYFATEYTLSHMGLDPEVRGNVTTQYFEAGHMMYIDTKCLSQLKKAVTPFLKGK